ncbi:MAG TPA: hypothetical protein VE620_09960 [Myxococcales bacterium]|nr:hypothetical protein [Myxococcales bacterium]
MRKLALLFAALAAAFAAAPASGHNAGHIILPDGTCLDVGSNKEAPVVAAPAPGNLATGQLDLIPGSGDQYGARFAATRGNTPILPGNCPS